MQSWLRVRAEAHSAGGPQLRPRASACVTRRASRRPARRCMGSCMGYGGCERTGGPVLRLSSAVDLRRGPRAVGAGARRWRDGARARVYSRRVGARDATIVFGVDFVWPRSGLSPGAAPHLVPSRYDLNADQTTNLVRPESRSRPGKRNPPATITRVDHASCRRSLSAPRLPMRACRLGAGPHAMG